jgi:hypothetical protein
MKDDRISDIPTFSPSYLHPLLGAPPITPLPQYPNILSKLELLIFFVSP